MFTGVTVGESRNTTIENGRAARNPQETLHLLPLNDQ